MTDINICFEGGGMRGIAYVGINKIFCELNISSRIKNIIGSSAGSIFAGLVACNISYPDMYNTIMTTKFENFLDGSFSYIGDAYRLLEKEGMYKGDYFYEWYGKILEKYTGSKNITFKQVYEKYNKNLIITGSNLTDYKSVYFCQDTEPDMPIRLAVRISMSIPILYEIMEYKGYKWVDGGYLNNYPVNYFFSKGEPKEIIIGFKLLPPSQQQPPFKINNIKDLISNLLESSSEIIEDLRAQNLGKERKSINTIYIDSCDVQTMDFVSDYKKFQKLIDTTFEKNLNDIQKIID